MTFACRLIYNARRDGITPLPPDSDNILSALGENQPVRLEDRVARIKNLRQQREALLKRTVELQKKARTGASVLAILTRLLDGVCLSDTDAATTENRLQKRISQRNFKRSESQR